MSLYYAFRNLASYIDRLQSTFLGIQNATRNVFVIGQYLSSWFGTLAAVCGFLESAAEDIAAEWWTFYNWITHNSGIGDDLQDLLSYASQLIQFIRFPGSFLWNVIRNNLPALYSFQDDPISYVLEIIYRYTGLTYDFIHNPFAVIRNVVDASLGSFRYILDNPDGWLFDKVGGWVHDFQTFVYNPGEWVRRRIDEQYPLLDDFLRDPQAFLQEQLLSFLDAIADRYRDRAIRIFEKVLNAIF